MSDPASSGPPISNESPTPSSLLTQVGDSCGSTQSYFLLVFPPLIRGNLRGEKRCGRAGYLHPMLRLVLPPIPSTTSPSPRSAIRLPKSASFLRCSPSSPHRSLSLSRFPYLALRCPLSGVPFALTAAECSVEEDDGFDEELGILLALLPKGMRERLDVHPDRRQLVEVVMDLGRRPFARFPTGDFFLSDDPITLRDLQHATSQVGDFTADNRAGICRTLHRISAIRNRKGAIVGLTCRVGRAVSGSANMLRDLVLDGASFLLIGPPGVGKTTIIRDIARMLADDFKKRVMIVDTSNEIGGDGDIPHPGIGSARRMQVPNPDMQHKVLIETVENHMPQVIVIDEIGTRLEAMAASTIAQRGIQLVATAHGVTIENLTVNPSLETLVGGIQSVTLGDDEASRRGVQKTVLERKGPSTFTCGVEIVSKTEMRVHRSLEATVDALLSGRSPLFEIRKMGSQALPNENPILESERFSDIPFEQPSEVTIQEGIEKDEKVIDENNSSSMEELIEHSGETEAFIHLYVYGILETSVAQAITQLRLDGEIKLTDNISEADAFLALHSKLKKNSRIQAAAKSHDMPIYVTKASSLLQITKALRALVAEHGNAFQNAEGEDNTSLLEKADALEEARLAIEQVVIPEGEAAELLPRSPHIISAQMDFIQGYNLKSEKVGKEPNFHLRILPSHTCTTYSELEVDHGFEESGISDDINSSYNGTFRLPFLPE